MGCYAPDFLRYIMSYVVNCNSVLKVTCPCVVCVCVFCGSFLCSISLLHFSSSLSYLKQCLINVNVH